MRDGIERDLAALGGSHVSSQLGNQGMRGLMTGRRKEKNDVPDNAERQIRCVHGLGKKNRNYSEKNMAPGPGLEPG